MFAVQASAIKAAACVTTIRSLKQVVRAKWNIPLNKKVPFRKLSVIIMDPGKDLVRRKALDSQNEMKSECIS